VGRPDGLRSTGELAAERVDQLAFVHLRPALDADLLGPLAQLIDVPVLVDARLAAAPTGLLARCVSDASGFSLLSPCWRSFSYRSGSLTLGHGQRRRDA
jgi:hypothetical protein